MAIKNKATERKSLLQLALKLCDHFLHSDIKILMLQIPVKTQFLPLQNHVHIQANSAWSRPLS